MYCPRCKAQNPDNSAFCNSCGFSLRANYPPPQQRQMQYRQQPQKKSGLSPIIIIGIVFFGLIFLLILFFGGSGGGSSSNNESPTEAPEVTVKVTEAPKPTEGTTADETTEPPTMKRKTSITMTDHHVSQDKAGDNVLVVEYDFYNGEDEPTSFSWTCTDQCFQNGVELSSFVLLLDEIDTHKQTADVQSGVTLHLSVGYKLEDMSDVNLVVKELLGDKVYIDETFPVQ